jgi:hypothetical protein
MMRHLNYGYSLRKAMDPKCSKYPNSLHHYRYSTGSLPLCAEPGYATGSPRVCPPALTIQAHKVFYYRKTYALICN